MTDPVRPVALQRLIAKWREKAHNIRIIGDEDFPYEQGAPLAVGYLRCANELEHLAAPPVQCAASPADPWLPIETAPRDAEVFFWIVPKTAEESYVDTSGKPIVGDFQPFLHRGKFKTWGGLSKATHWMPLPSPPRATGEGARDARLQTAADVALVPSAVRAADAGSALLVADAAPVADGARDGAL